MELAGRFLARIEMMAPFLGGLAVAIAFVLVNGGYVYKTECPLASGSTQTSWTYGIADILPYIRDTKPPCSSHTGTRLALSWIGIWPLGHSSATPKQITADDRKAAENLRVATSSLTTIAAQVAAYGKKNGGAALTPAFRASFIRFNNETLAAWQRVKTTLDRPIKATDAQLIDARKSVSTYIDYLIGSDRLFLTSKSITDYNAKLNAQYGSKVGPLIQRLRYLSVVVQTRYPQVKNWGFLPAK